MVLVHCRGCRRTVGLSQKDYPLYCSEDCAENIPATQTESRDALIEALFHIGYRAKQLGTLFGITRQRIDQILDRRKYVQGEFS